VIGILGQQSLAEERARQQRRASPEIPGPFFQGLKQAGYVEGQNVAVEYRYAENQLDRLPALAADLVRRRSP
jgi:hypothetical protein